MLPRIAKLDRQFARAIQNYVQARSRRTPLLSEINAHVIHEGHASAIRRTADEIEPTKMLEASAETKMSFDEIASVDLDYVLSKANEIAAQFEKHFSTNIFQSVDEVTQKTGLRQDAGGPLTNEALIKIFSMMEIDFERSHSGDVTIVTAPGMVSTFERLEREMNENPEIKKKWDEMMEERRNDFREREINRNLVG